jgi:hypothetical protein
MVKLLQTFIPYIRLHVFAVLAALATSREAKA